MPAHRRKHVQRITTGQSRIKEANARALLDLARERARIVNESGGVPLYAEEMLRQAARGVEAGVTPLMTDLAAVRLSRLSHAARNAVQFAAVAGDIDIALMLRASKKMDWNADDLPKILDELRQHGLISDQIPADFCYPLIRDAIYHSLSPGQRRRHHAHVAQCLIEGAEPSASTSIAMHLEMAQHGESGGVRIGDYVVVSP